MNERSFITKLYSNIFEEYDFGAEKYIIAEFLDYYIPRNYGAKFLYRLRFALQDRIKRLKAEGREIAHWVVVFDEVNNFIHDSKKKAAEQNFADAISNFTSAVSIDPYITVLHCPDNFSTSNYYTYTANAYVTANTYTTNYAAASYSTNYGINNYAIINNYASNYADVYCTL